MSEKKWWEAWIDANFTIHWAEEEECRINSTSPLRIIEYRAYQELKAENNQLKAQADKLAEALEQITSNDHLSDGEWMDMVFDTALEALTDYRQGNE